MHKSQKSDLVVEIEKVMKENDNLKDKIKK